jgi:hypothetical protein
MHGSQLDYGHNLATAIESYHSMIKIINMMALFVPGLQIQYGAINVPGGFDSHTFPPLPCFRRYPVPQRY